jgi:hypothetical protein
MEILFLFIFATIGALWMKKNGLSWIEGALWGGVLTLIGLIVIFFRIKSSKKNPKIVQTSEQPYKTDINTDEKTQLGSLLRFQANRQILFGLAWWSGSAIAMYFALQSTGNAIFWFGGALGALFHWYRAYKLFEVGRDSKVSIFRQNDFILIAFTLIIAIGTFSKIVPEYFRIDVPTIGTCWAKANNGLFTPVACWSNQANFKTVFFTTNPDGCGTLSFFEPSLRETRYTCLEGINKG